MLRSEVQVLFGFDRWATRRILNASVAAFEATPAVWSRPAVVGERGLGGILVHALGAHQRWRRGVAGQFRDAATGARAAPLAA